MNAEMQISELLSCDNSKLETFGDYTAKFKKLNEQIVSAQYQIQTLKGHDSRYRTERFAKLIQHLYDAMSTHVHKMDSVALAISHALAWAVDPEDRKIVSDFIFADRPLEEIAREHKVSERCIRNLLQEYNQTTIPENLIDEYLDKSKRKRQMVVKVPSGG